MPRALIPDNLASATVKCACFEQLLEGIRAVDLLVIDAEGYDADVLRAFPFARVHTARVIFEPYHLSGYKKQLAKNVLTAHGFEMIRAQGWAVQEWKKKLANFTHNNNDVTRRASPVRASQRPRSFAAQTSSSRFAPR